MVTVFVDFCGLGALNFHRSLAFWCWRLLLSLLRLWLRGLGAALLHSRRGLPLRLDINPGRATREACLELAGEAFEHAFDTDELLLPLGILIFPQAAEAFDFGVLLPCAHGEDNELLVL